MKPLHEYQGLPYMGSKRRIATQIVSRIVSDNPGMKYFYDLFGGGGSISAAVLRHRDVFMEHQPHVFYNEKNQAIVSLIQKLRDGISIEEMIGWVSREDFDRFHKGDDWKAGLMQTCWSFGSGQTGYLFGESLIEYKKAFHDIVINNKSSLDMEVSGKKIKIEIDCLCKGVFERYRLATQHLRLENPSLTSTHSSLECVERIKRVHDYSSVAKSSRLSTTCQSYDAVKIETPIDETVIYLDPPYRGTAGYLNEIDHDKLDRWVLKNPYKVYVSEYEFPSLSPIMSIDKSSTLGDNSKVATEHLFCNRI